MTASGGSWDDVVESCVKRFNALTVTLVQAVGASKKTLIQALLTAPEAKVSLAY